MRNNHWIIGVARALAFTLVLSGAGLLTAQSQPRPPAKAGGSAPVSEENLAATRNELFKLLRMSPKLTAVVSRDPSLLSNQDYVSRNNPELATFLQAHPEVARNPEFYLFANAGDGRYRPPELTLQQQVWPEIYRGNTNSLWVELGRDLVPFLVFLCILFALLWILRVLLENRRWNRIVKLQTEIHSRLLDKFSTNEEMVAYMGTEAGKRFLEAAQIPLGAERLPGSANPIARILTPVQLGAVLALVGIGFLYLRGNVPDAAVPFLVFGVLGLVLGIGFIISAGLAWALARQFGFLPQTGAQAEDQSKLSARGQM